MAGLEWFLIGVGVVELTAEDIELADKMFDFGEDLSGQLGDFGRRGLVGLLRARGFAEDGCEMHGGVTDEVCTIGWSGFGDEDSNSLL